MFALLIHFLSGLAISTFKHFLPFFRKVFPWLSSYSHVIAYVAFSASAYAALVFSANELIKLVSSSAVSNEILRIGFSYLPHNISFCVNTIIAVQFTAFVYSYKDKVYRFLISKLFKV